MAENEERGAQFTVTRTDRHFGFPHRHFGVSRDAREGQPIDVSLTRRRSSPAPPPLKTEREEVHHRRACVCPKATTEQPVTGRGKARPPPPPGPAVGPAARPGGGWRAQGLPSQRSDPTAWVANKNHRTAKTELRVLV